MEFIAKVNAEGKAYVKFLKESVSKDIGNAFIPRVTCNKEDKEGFKIYEDKQKISLSNHLDKDKREITPKIIRLKSKGEIKIKFHVEKGNKNANDSDGGIIKAHYFKKEEEKHTTSHSVTGYNTDIELTFSRDKEITHIKFYADDNDTFFDGDVNNVYSGYVKISNTCQDPLVEKKLSSISLTDKQKAQFMATLLAETAHGHKGLWKIAWVYFNLVSSFGFEKGMKNSAAYKNKDVNYKLWLFYFNHGKEFKNDEYYGGEKISSYAEKNGYFKTKILPRAEKYKAFVNSNVLINNPKNKYNEWYGQGYWRDLNYNPDDKKGTQWYKARQYYLLQLECKVEKTLIIIMEQFENTSRGVRDLTSFIFDYNAIQKFFKENPSLLPKSESVLKYKNGDGKKYGI